jgi:hypothetical protein
MVFIYKWTLFTALLRFFLINKGMSGGDLYFSEVVFMTVYTCNGICKLWKYKVEYNLKYKIIYDLYEQKIKTSMYKD